MANYYKVTSLLKAENVLNYVVKKDGKNQSVDVSIPGQYTRRDFTREGDPRPFIFITEEVFKGLSKEEHGGNPSHFTVLKDENKIIVNGCDFIDLPAEYQEKFDPVAFAKLNEARKKELSKIAESEG